MIKREIEDTRTKSASDSVAIVVMAENAMETETEEAGNSDGGGSRKRPLDTRNNEDEANSGSVTKKSNIAEVNSEEVLNVKVMIPAFATGALIGKSGETIATVQKETGCRIKMSKNNDVFPNTNERLALVSGTPSAVLKVVSFIAEKTKDKFDANAKSDDFDYKQTERWREIKIVIPSSCAGMVIGKGGEYIKSIKDHTGAFVQISAKDLVDPRLLERVVTIVGRDLNEILDGARMIIAKLTLDVNISTTPYTNVSYFHVTGGSGSGGGGGGGPNLAPRPSSPLHLGAGGGYLGASPFSSAQPFGGGGQSQFGAGGGHGHQSQLGAGPVGRVGPYQQLSAQAAAAFSSPTSANYNQSSRRSAYQSPQAAHSTNGAGFLNQSSALGAMNSSPGSFSSAWLHNPGSNNMSSSAGPVGLGAQHMAASASSNALAANNSSSSSSSAFGNLQVLQFLDGLRTTLRTNGYNETSVAEIMQAMQILAKYNVLGLGLGFGLAAISKISNQSPNVPAAYADSDVNHGGNSVMSTAGLNPMAFGHSKDPYQSLHHPGSPITHSNALGGSGAANRYTTNIGFAGFDSPMQQDIGGGGDAYVFRQGAAEQHRSSTNMGGGGGGRLPGYHTVKSEPQESLSNVGYVSRSTMRFDQSPRSPGQRDYAASVLKEFCTDTNKLELTIPESIVGAVLGKQGKNLLEIQHYSGAKVEVSKRGHVISGTQDRMISIEGSTESIRIARAKIEKSINEEQQKRSGGGGGRGNRF